MKIVLFRGRPGVGKTTLSKRFAEIHGLVLISKDDICEVILNDIQEHETRNKICYSTLYSILENNLSSDSTFVLDFPFQNTNDFSIIKKWCTEREVPFKSILVTCSDEALWEKRFNSRILSHRPSRFLKNFQFLKKHYGTLEVPPEPGEIVLDSVNTVDDSLTKIAHEHILAQFKI